jgi:hypothetical protein
MTKQAPLTIDVTPKARQQIEELARRRGYAALQDYLLALIESDAQAHGEIVNLDAEDTKESLLEGFRQSWQEAMTGKTVPLSNLWGFKNLD